jgi:DNA-binding NarL/FixJ family response regulator
MLVSLLPRLDRAQWRLGDDLTARETEVLHLVALGMTNQQIGNRLSLKTNTVRNHVQNILTKLGAHSKLQAAAVARQEGLLDQGD